MVIAKNSVVTMAYSLFDAHGGLLEECTSEQPLEYVQGLGQVVPAIEKALAGQTPGYNTSVRVSPELGFGVYRSELVTDMPREKLPQGIDIQVGMKFNTAGPDGDPLTVRIIDVKPKTVTVDGNHPLAGQALVFEIRVLNVRHATEEELLLAKEDPDSKKLH